MQTIHLYQVAWENTHASGVFDSVFRSRRAAEQYARAWKRDMVDVEETPEDRRTARQVYQWEILTLTFYVERVYEWPGHSWHVFVTDRIPRSPILKECPYSLLYRSLCSWLAEVRDVTALENCSK